MPQKRRLSRPPLIIPMLIAVGEAAGCERRRN
jgi:hypothetical protein